jgi:hypothetical protein
VSDIQNQVVVAQERSAESSAPVSATPSVGDLVKAAIPENKAATAAAMAPGPAAASTTPAATVKDVIMKGVEFKLLEDAAVVTTPNGTSKTISLQDCYNMIAYAFNKAVEENGAEIMLPRNCVYIRSTSKTMYVTLYYPESVQELHFQAGGVSRKYKIPTPNIVICLSLDIATNPKGDSEARIGVTKYFCTDYPLGALKIKHTTQVDHANGIYLMPFSNVYDDGKLCTGENAMPSVMPRNDLRRINWQFDVLWSSPFNNDLGLNALSGWDAGVQSWYAHLAERLTNGQKFPYDRLRGYRPAVL